MKNKFIKLPLFLVAFAFGAALILGLLHEATRQRIADNQARTLGENYFRVFDFNGTRAQAEKTTMVALSITADAIAEEVKTYKVEEIQKMVSSDSSLFGFALITFSPGFQSDVKVLSGFDANLNYVGSVIYGQDETAGIGTLVTEPVNEYFVATRIEADASLGVGFMAGATVTTDAAVTAGKNAIKFVSNNKTYLEGQ